MSNIGRYPETLSSEEIQRRVRELDLRSNSTGVTVFNYDPIFTPLFTAILGTGFGLTGTALAVGVAVATTIATTALTIGIQALMAPKPPKVEDLRYPLRQAVPYRFWGVGRTRAAGAYMLYESTGVNMYGVQAIMGHRIRSFNRFWLHDDEVTVPFNGGIVSFPGFRYGSNVFINHRVGLPVETPYQFVADAFAASGLWSIDHVGHGQATIAWRASATREKDQRNMFPYGAPQVSVEGDWALCWDFRDIDQDPENPETWKWTRNSALIIAWHLCFNEFGFREDYRKAIAPVVDFWIEDADICDENVPLAGGGVERRYQCSGVETTENGPKSGLNAMLATCDGHLVRRGDGARILTVGKFRESRCATLSDQDILGYRYAKDVPFEDEINRLIPIFTYPETDYTSSDTDYFEDVAAQLIAGRPLAENATYQWCTAWRQARRLGKRDWLRLLQKVTGTLDVRTSGINAAYHRWVRLDTPIMMPDLNEKLIENRLAELNVTAGGFSIEFVQHPENIDEWIPSVDEGKQPPVPVAQGQNELQVPVINLVQARSSNGSVYIRAIIIDPEDGSLTPTVFYRIRDTGFGVPGSWVEYKASSAVAVGGYISLDTGVVPADQELEIEAAFIGTGGNYSERSPTQDVVSIVDATPPAPPVNFAAVLSSATITLSAKAVNDNTRNLVFKRGTTVQSFASATLLGQYSVTANQTITAAPDTPGSGTWRYWCESENGSGIASGAPVFLDRTV